MIAAICYSLWSNASEVADGKRVSNASTPQGHATIGAAAASRASASMFIIQSDATSSLLASAASDVCESEYRNAFGASNQRTVS